MQILQSRYVARPRNDQDITDAAIGQRLAPVGGAGGGLRRIVPTV
ncbi:hypothetical protein [Streptomyces sp. NPDC002671]